MTEGVEIRFSEASSPCRLKVELQEEISAASPADEERSQADWYKEDKEFVRREQTYKYADDD